jgi:hypothetical protein
MEGLRFLWIILISPIWLYGCVNVKKAIGVEKTSPDSFKVNPRTQGLEVPPYFSLSYPQKPSKVSSYPPLTEAEKELLARVQSSP